MEQEWTVREPNGSIPLYQFTRGPAELPRHDDSEWALPTRPRPDVGEKPTLKIEGPFRDSPPDRQVIALEQIAKTLELVRLEISMMNMSRDRVIR